MAAFYLREHDFVADGLGTGDDHMRFLIIIVIIFSINIYGQGLDLNHAFSFVVPEEYFCWEPILFAVLRIGEVLKSDIWECKSSPLLFCFLVGQFEKRLSNEVEICDDTVVVRQADHFHAAESRKFEEDLPLFFGWAVDDSVLNGKQMAKLMIEET